MWKQASHRLTELSHCLACEGDKIEVKKMEVLQTQDFTLCPKFEKAFTILGKKWNGLILDVLVEDGPQRFVDLANKIPDVSDRVLVERLKELAAEGILVKHQNLYSLTDKGIDLENSLISVKQWSEKWITEAECS